MDAQNDVIFKELELLYKEGNAIKEKLQREKVEIVTKYKESLDECPF